MKRSNIPPSTTKLQRPDPIANDFTTTTAAVCDEQLAPEVGRVPVNKDREHLLSILVPMPSLHIFFIKNKRHKFELSY